MRDGIIVRTAEGVFGGILGTAFIGRSQRLSRHELPEAVRPTEPRQEPGEFVTARIEWARGEALHGRAHERVKRGLHWAYGMGWGALLGALGPAVRIRTLRGALLAGAGLGVAVWGVGYLGWLPAAGLTERPTTPRRAAHAATDLALHVGYGLVTALPVLALERLRTRRKSFVARLLDEARDRFGV